MAIDRRRTGAIPADRLTNLAGAAGAGDTRALRALGRASARGGASGRRAAQVLEAAAGRGGGKS